MSVKIRRVWTAYGRDIDFCDMDEDYILNCIALLQRRKEALTRVDKDWDTSTIARAVTRQDDMIQAFLEELEERNVRNCDR